MAAEEREECMEETTWEGMGEERGEWDLQCVSTEIRCRLHKWREVCMEEEEREECTTLEIGEYRQVVREGHISPHPISSDQYLLIGWGGIHGEEVMD